MVEQPIKRDPQSRQVAIVTGGGSGVGRGLCMTLAKEGHRVAVLDVDPSAARKVVTEIELMGGNAIDVEVDICDAELVVKAIDRVAENWGRIDSLVNCAGWSRFVSPADYTIDLWQKVRSINLDGTWHCCQAVAGYMRRQRSGRIVNIGSSAAILANPNQAPYVVAKHGVVGLTRALAVDLAPFGITVNCVCPTTIETPLGLVSTTTEFRQRMVEQIPMGRLCHVEDVIHVIRFLLSEHSAFVTGVILPVDGGLTCCRRAHHLDSESIQ